MSFVISADVTGTQTVTSSGYGVVLDSGSIVSVFSTGVQMTSSGSLVVNGEIVTIGALAVDAAGNSAIEIGPTGSITSAFNSGAISTQAFDAISYDNSSGLFNFVNHGFVSGASEALFADASNLSLFNSGLLQATNDQAINATVNNFLVFQNTGTIESLLGTAVNITGGAFGYGIGAFVNTGEILSASAAITMTGAGYGALRNEGRIVGEVSLNGLSGSTLTLRNTGEIQGDVLLGSENGIYRGRSGEVSGTVYGQGGNDLIELGALDNFADGGNDNDTLMGGAGEDTLLGGSGFDRLYGNGDNDSLDGGGRTDYLYGGKGDDTMTGGGGGDVFVIRRVGNGDDEVTDFQNGSDVVDISALGVQNFNALNNVFGALSQDNDSVIIDLAAAGGSGSIRLVGVTLADMDASDFIF